MSETLVAIAGPMTGQYAAFGADMRRGAALAMPDVVKSLGEKFAPIRLVVEDDRCEAAEAIAVARRLVALKVALVIGHHCASASIAAAPIYAAAGIIQISPSTNDPRFTEKRAGPTTFRLAPRSDGEGPFIGAYMARVFAGKRVAILHDRTVITMQLAAGIRKEMNAGGLTEALYLGFVAGERDYSKLARDLHTQRIEAVFLGAFPNEAALILRALRNEDLATIVVGGALMDTTDFYKAAHSMLDARVIQLGTIGADPLGPAGKAPQSGGGEVAQRTWSALQVWAQADAIATGNSRPGNALTHVIQTRTFTTESGVLAFDKKGDAKLPFYKMFSWRDGDTVVPAP